MKILVIPDIHENLVFLKYILGYEKAEEFDKIVCLGDYFDPPQGTVADDQNLQQLAGTIMGLKEVHGDRLHLICGNHDQPYYAIRAAFAKKGEGPEKIACNWLPQTTVPRAVMINRLWDEEFWRQLEVAVLLDGWLFSHAGIHEDWWPADLPDTESRYQWLQEQWQEGLDHTKKGIEHPIFGVGKARGGSLPKGGPLWLDWGEEFEDSLEIPQIVGHTRCPEPTQKGRSFCIDFAQGAYAIVEDGDVQLRIWPQSWLGETLLD